MDKLSIPKLNILQSQRLDQRNVLHQLTLSFIGAYLVDGWWNISEFSFSSPSNIFMMMDMEPFPQIIFFLPCKKFACFSHNFAMPLFGMLYFLVAPYSTFFLVVLEGVRQKVLLWEMS